VASSLPLISKLQFNANTARAAAFARCAGHENRKASLISATIRTTRATPSPAPPVTSPPAPARAPAAATRPASGPPAVRLGRGPITLFGKLYFKTREGELVELPSDITYEEAVTLEAEAKAAETRLGKGPQPQPVPDAKKLVKKEEAKKPKAAAKGSRVGKAKSRAAARAGTAAAGMLKAVGPSKVAQYLAAKAAPVLQKGFAKLQKLSQNEQTHDDAADKREQAEKAVIIPDSEGQSKSNAGQVNTVSGRPAPTADESRGKQKLQDSLRKNLPRKVEDVDNFKRDQKAEHMGSDVMAVVLQDKNAVVSTYQDLGQTPPPAPREHEPEELPPQEAAPGTAGMNLGKDAIAPLQKEHTDVSSYTKDADKKLEEEGVIQEQLDMVDSGDLAAANKEKKGMAKVAKQEPLAIQKFAQQQADSVDKDLKQAEDKQRQTMRAKRKSGLAATAKKQKTAKSELEKKREEVAAKINGIYTAAQDKVKKRLADLETESMKRFDDGNAKASKKFEDDVNRELDAFKADRYSGWFGWARRVKDWFKGIDELPEVKAILDRNREIFVTTINKLVENITADNKRVIQECKDELQNARNKIAVFVKGLQPSLQGIGKQAAAEMNSKLDEMDKFIAKKEEELQESLKDKQTAAIKAIDEKIEKMKEAMSGALAKLGKLLLLAAKKFFSWALEKFGFSLSEIENIINKGVAVLKAIFTKPIQFVKNLIKAATTGFENFRKNFLTYLKDALFEWLTGSLEGLVLPSTWDFKGIIGVALQMIGISYQNIRRHMVEVMGENVVAGLEKTFELVKTLITKGPMAAWEQLKEMAAEMRDAFIDAVKDFIKQKIVEQAIIWIGSLLIPGAGIVKAIIGIYDTVVFFIKKAKEIMKMIGNFLGSISEIAAGNIGAAAGALEKGLARGLSLVISFLASLLRLTGVTNKIREAIQKIRGKVDAVLSKVAKWIADKAKVLIGKGVVAVKTGVAAVLQWWKKKVKIGQGKNAHTLLFHGEKKSAVLYIESTPRILREYLASLRRDPDYTGAEHIKTLDRIDKRINDIEIWEKEEEAAANRGHVNVAAAKSRDISDGFDYIGVQLGQLFLGEAYGTEADPIPLDWPGPSSDKYPVMYFGGRLPSASRPKSQSVMKGIHNRNQNDETGTPVIECRPFKRTTLPGGGTIGLEDPFFIRIRRIVGPLSQETTKSGEKLRKLIKPYGFNAKIDGLELDHVHEIQFGGLAKNDKVENLWPLAQALNSRKGPTLSRADVEYPKGHTVKIATLKTIKNDDVRKKKKFYFRIKSVE